MYAFALHEYAMVAKIKAHSVSVHEWGADYAVVSVNVDEVEVSFFLHTSNIYRYFSAIAYF